MDVYDEHLILLTGLTALLTMIPGIWLYGRDGSSRETGGLISSKRGRKLSIPEKILLFFEGAALALFMNFIMALFQLFVPDRTYQESMAQITLGKSLFTLIFWMGIVAPVAEEIIFRWLMFLRLRDYMRFSFAMVISGLVFGIYHGNLVQAIYAAFLGMAFAYFLELTGSLQSCVLLHIGANVWSLVFPEIMACLLSVSQGYQIGMIAVWSAFMAVMVFGLFYFRRKDSLRRTRKI